ncbi:MAG TPA: o-succinylbenzoate synthase, partial [Trichocoleus sp.]
MRIWVEHRPYSRPFRQPLQTAHGNWALREGILLRLTDETGRTGFGEIAPIPWFGSESVEAALACCERLKGWQEIAQLTAISPELPACQFGFGLALWELQGSFLPVGTEFPARTARAKAGHKPLQSDPKDNGGVENEWVCGLLPAGEGALVAWQKLWERGHRTFKWKVGVYGAETELGWLRKLVTALPAGGRLRLDANGGLTKTEAVQWLESCEGLPGIEFMEQPLPPLLITVLELSHRCDRLIQSQGRL